MQRAKVIVRLQGLVLEAAWLAGRQRRRDECYGEVARDRKAVDWSWGREGDRE